MVCVYPSQVAVKGCVWKGMDDLMERLFFWIKRE